MKKMHSKKKMNCLSNGIDCEIDCNHDVSNYVIKNANVLKQQLTNGILIAFVTNERNECLFLVKNRKHSISIMGLHYFDLAQVKNAVEPMRIAKDGPAVK